MRSPSLLAVLALLVLASCSSNDPDDIVLPSRTALVERYGTLAPGTFRVRQPGAKIKIDGSLVTVFDVGVGVGGGYTTYDLISNNLNIMDLGIPLKSTASVGIVNWFGSYRGQPTGSRSCSGQMYVIDVTASIVRAVFAGVCSKNGMFRGPYDFTLVEGGFAYVR